jgi:hypothetical protein
MVWPSGRRYDGSESKRKAEESATRVVRFASVIFSGHRSLGDANAGLSMAENLKNAAPVNGSRRPTVTKAEL